MVVDLILPLGMAFVVVGFGSYLGCRQALKDFYGGTSWDEVKERGDT